MSYPAQAIASGKLLERVQQELQVLARERILERVWAKDPGLWPGTDAKRKDVQANLSWLDLLETLRPYLEQMGKAADAAIAEGLTDWVLLSIRLCSLRPFFRPQ